MKKYIAVIAVYLFTIHSFNIKAQTSNDVLTIAEQMPEYPGGTEALINDINLRVVYPKQCSDSNIQGKVFLRFIVNEDGSLSNIEAVKGPHPLLNAAAINAVKEIKKFIPGMQKGKPVKVLFSLPVSFKIKTVLPEKLSISSIPDTPQFDALPEADTIYNYAQIPPQFPGTDQELIDIVYNNTKYPEEEPDKKIEGYVYLMLVIMEDGSFRIIKVLRSLSPALDKEAVRVARLLPKFKPGMVNGKAVKCYYMLPFGFNKPRYIVYEEKKKKSR